MNRSFFRSFCTQITPLPHPTGDFTSKTIIVTGANVGLGLEAARHFVRLNASKVILACRNIEKGEQAKSDIEASEARPGVVEIWQVDLGSFASVQSFCRRANGLERLDVVIENAALQTATHQLYEGYERSVTVNIISTYLMALLLLPAMRRTVSKHYDPKQEAAPHLVSVGSNAHFYAPLHERDKPSILDALRGDSHMIYRYYDTKLISVMLMQELAARMESGEQPRVICNMPEPGFCQSELTREKMFPLYVRVVLNIALEVLARTSEQGSRTYIAAACAGPESHGQYLEDCELSTPSDFVRSEEGLRLQKKVWSELITILESIEPGISGNL